MQSESHVAHSPSTAFGVVGGRSTGWVGDIDSQVAAQSPTALGMVGTGSTGSVHSDQVVDHSPPTLGMVGDGSTGSESFVALDDYQIYIDSFLCPSETFPHAGDQGPMRRDRHDCLIPTGPAPSDLASVYADQRTFIEHSQRTYKGTIFLYS